VAATVGFFLSNPKEPVPSCIGIDEAISANVSFITEDSSMLLVKLSRQPAAEMGISARP
jgi:hypothetical protein